MAIHYDPYGSGKYTKGAIDVVHRGKNYTNIPSLARALQREARSKGGLSDRSATASAIFMANRQSGRQDVNRTNLKNAKAVLKQRAKAKHSKHPAKIITGIAGGLTAAGLAASLAPGLVSGIGTPSKITTGVASGNTASSTLGPALFNNFSTQGLVKGALTGAANSALGGGNISDILKGAALSGVTGGISPGLSQSLGLSGKFSQAFEGGLSGLASGLSKGNLKSAFTGAGLGAVGGYVLGSPKSGGKTSTDDLLGVPVKSFGNNTMGLWDKGMSFMQDYGRPLGVALSGAYNYLKTSDIEDQLKESQNRILNTLRPYQKTGSLANALLMKKINSGELGGSFDEEDFIQDPGYQFRLQEGRKSLDRQQAARGNLYSGKALKEAQNYAQGIASQSFEDAYKRWLESQLQDYRVLSGSAQSGLQASQGLADAYENLANIQSHADTARSNILTRTLANLLSGTNKSLLSDYI